MKNLSHINYLDSEHQLTTCPNEWASVLLDAARLKPLMRVCYSEDIRWLFRPRLLDWVESTGDPLDRIKAPYHRLRKSDATIFQGDPLSHEMGLPRLAPNVIHAEFCLGYGFDDYSHNAINYSHYQRETAIPSSYVSVGPKSLGNFAVVLNQKPIGYVRPLPGELRSCGMAELPYGKNRSVQVWLGVWYARESIRPALLEAIESFPNLSTIWPRWPRNEYGLSKFMEYYGDLGNDEVALRQQLGFKPKGKTGLSEEILYRSVLAIFGEYEVKRNYRGKEIERLEIDVWVPELKLGFEYQGEQHYERIAHWHGEHGLRSQQERDARKKQLCEALGYRILWLEPGSDLRREAILIELRELGWISPEY